MGRLVLIAGVAGALVLGAAGCGSDSDATQAAREELLRDLDSCEPQSLPVRVRVHNSGLSCGAAIAMRIVMVDTPGSQTVESSQGGEWVCTDLPPAREPLLTVCRQGERFFTLEARD